jgi:hypothetical protein
MFVKSLFAWLTRCTTLRPSVEFLNDILRMWVSVKTLKVSPAPTFGKKFGHPPKWG